MQEYPQTYGAESEKIAVQKNGRPFALGNDVFLKIQELLAADGYKTSVHTSELDSEHILGIQTNGNISEVGKDNGALVQESATNILSTLQDVNTTLNYDARLINTALEEAGAHLVDLSMHLTTDPQTNWNSYRQFVAKKGLYAALWARRWEHTAGMRGQSQNSPATGVDIDNAAAATSVMFAASAANIALFANSPEFDVSGNLRAHSTRASMWDVMLAKSPDSHINRFPTKPFYTLADYFNWIYSNTPMFFTIEQSNVTGYKGIGEKILMFNNPPTIMEYLKGEQWKAYRLADHIDIANFPWASKPEDNFIESPVEDHIVIPSFTDAERLQFMTFSAARFRFSTQNGTYIDPKDFVAACSKPDKNGVEELLAKSTFGRTYIEGRDPCAQMPTRYHNDLGIGESVLIGPSALQAGLLANLNEAYHFLIEQHRWESFKALRAAAMKRGFDGEYNEITVKSLTTKVLELAHTGLESLVGSKEAAKLMAFNWHILTSGENGATRAEKFMQGEITRGSLRNALYKLAINRKAEF